MLISSAALAKSPRLDLIVENRGAHFPPLPVDIQFALLSDGTVFYQGGRERRGGMDLPRFWIARISATEHDTLLRQVSERLAGLDGVRQCCGDDPAYRAHLCELARRDTHGEPCITLRYDATTDFIRYRDLGDQVWHEVGVVAYAGIGIMNHYDAPKSFAVTYDALESFVRDDAQSWTGSLLRVQLAAQVSDGYESTTAEWPRHWVTPRTDRAIVCLHARVLDDPSTWPAILLQRVRDRDDPDRTWYIANATVDLPEPLASALELTNEGRPCS